jgi:predicted nucleotidyltransferase
MAGNPEQQIEKFAARLEQALGGNLESLLLFGSTARGDGTTGQSDINLLLVVRDARSEALRPAAGAIAEWARSQPAPLIFSAAEWAHSADVFPLEIEDMRDAHRVIRGRDPLAGITTTRDHLRHQLEREVREKLLHLRAAYAAAAPYGRPLARLLEESVGTFLVLCRGTIRLAGRTPPRDPHAVVQAAAELAGLDVTAFDWPLARRAGRATAALKRYDPVGSRYLDEIEKLAQYVNRQ